MKVALETHKLDPTNPLAWSGLPHAMLNMLTGMEGVEVDILGPLDPGLRLPEGVRKMYWEFRSQRYLWAVEPRITALYGRQLTQKLEISKPDVVLSLTTIGAAALPVGTPFVVYHDSTLKLNQDYYPYYSNICRRSDTYGHAVDQQAFRRARHVIVTSEWAAASVVNDYGAKPERVSFIPIGAQHVCSLNLEAIEVHARPRFARPMRLLWMGADWERKRGDFAIAVATEMHSRGFPVDLQMVGALPPDDARALPYVRAHGFMDRRTQQKVLEDILLSSFAMLLPSMAENSPIGIADCASFGVPTLASDTGGIGSMISHDITGALLPLDASPAAYADVLERLWSDQAAYMDMVRATRRRFEAELSWDAAKIRIREVLFAAARNEPIGQRATIFAK